MMGRETVVTRRRRHAGWLAGWIAAYEYEYSTVTYYNLSYYYSASTSYPYLQ